MKKIFLLISAMLLTLAANATAPELNKTTPVTLMASTATLSSNGSIVNDSINWPEGTIHQGFAKWRVNLGYQAAYAVTVDMRSNNTFFFRISVVDPVTGDTLRQSRSVKESNKVYTDFSCGTLNMGGLPKGEYDIVITDTIKWSHAKIASMTLTYAKGDLISVPATLAPADAMLSQYATLDETGTVDTLTFAPKTSEWNACDAEYTVAGSQYVKWNIKVQGGKYKFTANTYCKQGHNYRIMVLNANETSIIYTKQEKEGTGYDYHNEGADWQVATDAIDLPAGNYVVKMQGRNYGRVMSVEAEYVGGAIQNISTSTNTTLNVADAWFTSGATRAEGQISYSSWNSEDSWVKWNIATSETKFYDLTLNFSSTNAHSMKVNIYEDEEASPVATVSESWTDTHGTLTLTDRVNLVGGKNYIVKVTNPTSGSAAKVTSVVFAPVVATATSLPNTLAFSNAVLSEKANITDGMLYFNTPNADKDPRGQWAQWSVTTDHDGLFLFTMGVNSTNEQTYKITIKDDSDNEIDFYESSPGSGAKTLTHYFALDAGSYFVKVENTRSYSKGHLTSLVVTEPGDVMTINENATSNSDWSGKVDDENTYNVRIIRTLKANMYNTFCLPFRVPDDMCKDLFGSDVEIYTLDEATVDDNILNLELDKSSDVWQGTPVFIKPSRNIVNPVFSGVEFKVAAPSASIGTNANFTGSFVATTLGPDPDILFLAQDNMLYYPQDEIPILGMRGWLVLHDSPAPISPRRANFILPDKMPTAIEIVNGDILPLDKTMKVIENGQLIIIRDGVRYNVMGVRVK